MEDAYATDVSAVASHFSVDLSSGLNESQVLQARGVYGPNELAPDAGTPFWKLVLKQFDDLLVKILLAAAFVDLFIAWLNGDTGLKAVVEPIVILLILLANAIVGVVTETNAEKAIEELKAYEADNATVLREDRLSVVPRAELVPGDVVEVAVGGKVPADVRIAQLFSSALRVDQSVLTGESGAVGKHVDAVKNTKAVAQDKTCILFSGTMVTSGRARGIVVGTGGGTAIGKIRDAVAESTDEMTPLKRKLDEFGTLLSKVIAGICILVWVMNIRHFSDPIHGGLISGALYYFKIAVALAVAAIPEGLPAVVTTCLAMGARKMAREHAIVRSLPSVETLGSTTVICCDKTGTLTTNKMSVAKICVMGADRKPMEYDVTGSTYAPEGMLIAKTGMVVTHPADSQTLRHLAMCAALCNDSTLIYKSDTGVYQGGGESMEVALRTFVEKVGLPGYAAPYNALEGLSKQERATFCNAHWQEQYPRTSTCEFTSKRKMMSVLCGQGKESFLFVKGAPEVVLPMCQLVLQDGSESPDTMADETRWLFDRTVSGWGSSMALRSLALAYKPLKSGNRQILPGDENDLILIGIVGIHDPPRCEAGDAVEACKTAGIRVIMVTGDNIDTARSVGFQVGIINDETSEGAKLLKGKCATGVGFDQLSVPDQRQAVMDMAVFARVEPMHKSKLVEILKSRGDIVAVTGDGVNDAPALKKANIGIAMGTGTAVARHAADMVLADDNFATIVSAVREGRAIYDNTRQFIRYMISSNVGEVVCIFVAALLGIPETLNPVQLLWVNLVTDGLPATALGFNKPDNAVMQRRPRNTNDSIVNGWMFFRYMVVGLYVGIVSVWGFIWWFLQAEAGPKLTWNDLRTFQSCVEGERPYPCSVFSDPRASTISMSVLVMVEMFNALNALSEDGSLLEVPPWSNFWLLGAIALSIALHLFILYFPAAAALFSVTGLGLAECWQVVLLSFPVIFVDEMLKFLSRKCRGSWSRGSHGMPMKWRRAPLDKNY